MADVSINLNCVAAHVRRKTRLRRTRPAELESGKIIGKISHLSEAKKNLFPRLLAATERDVFFRTLGVISRGKKIYDDGFSEPVVVASSSSSSSSRRRLEPSTEADVVIVKSAIQSGSADNFTHHFHDYRRRCCCCFPSVSHLRKYVF